MTYDTSQTNPCPPAGDVQPIPVHVTGIEPAAAAALPAPRRRRKVIVTRFGTETVDDTNPVRPILPEDPGRVCAWLQASGGDVYLADTQAKASAAADTASSGEATLLPKANTAPWPVHGQQPVWAAQAAAAAACVISFTADYESEAV
jgi:hypothetical protein